MTYSQRDLNDCSREVVSWWVDVTAEIPHISQRRVNLGFLAAHLLSSTSLASCWYTQGTRIKHISCRAQANLRLVSYPCKRSRQRTLILLPPQLSCVTLTQGPNPQVRVYALTRSELYTAYFDFPWQRPRLGGGMCRNGIWYSLAL